jgi:hypothetical protein
MPAFDLGRKVGRKIAVTPHRRAVVLCVVDVADFDGSLPRAALSAIVPRGACCWLSNSGLGCSGGAVRGGRRRLRRQPAARGAVGHCAPKHVLPCLTTGFRLQYDCMLWESCIAARLQGACWRRRAGVKARDPAPCDTRAGAAAGCWCQKGLARMQAQPQDTRWRAAEVAWQRRASHRQGATALRLAVCITFPVSQLKHSFPHVQAPGTRRSRSVLQGSRGTWRAASGWWWPPTRRTCCPTTSPARGWRCGSSQGRPRGSETR